MTRAARVAAQAKINVWLKVGGVDARGYHEIFTLFQRIELADVVTVRVLGRSGESLHCTGPMLPGEGLGADDDNLALRAARAFRGRAGWPAGFEIEIDKRIPVGGGLGGGSADAGAVLRILNSLAPRPLADDAVLRVAAELGSDVPFLASSLAAALGTGRGQTLRGVPGPPAANVALIVPPFSVSTAAAYRWLDEAGRRSLDVAVMRASEPAARWRWDDLDLGNDFEPVVEVHHPELRDIRERLAAAGARLARLSGSGSTVFGVFPGGVPPLLNLPAGAVVIATRTSESVVQVEPLE